MRRRLRTRIVVTAALVAAVATYVAATLPPATTRLPGTPPASHFAGAYHIHTTRSDGTGTPDEIAAAAQRAGLQFIVLTDHGDGTREPDAPAYRHGVLVLDAVEVNTREGHVVALGLQGATPYRLAGSARDVVEDIRRLGGMAIAAHPDSPKTDLRWRAGGTTDGLEWLNVDSEWRDESARHLAGSAVRSLLRGPEAIAALFARPEQTLRRWDGAARVRPVVGLAALDAHASLGWREDEEPRRARVLVWPSYETLFHTLTQTAIVDEGLTGNAATDASRIWSALRAGRTYSTIRAHGWPSALLFGARQGGNHFAMGSRITGLSEPVEFSASTPTAPDAIITLVHNGQARMATRGELTAPSVSEPGVYRVEATLPGHPVPWLISNPIVLADSPPPPQGVSPVAPEEPGMDRIPMPPASPDWQIERDPTSTGTLDVEAGRLRFSYRLGEGSPRGQYAAVVHSDHSGLGTETVRFVAQADRPMRVSVQIRLPEGGGRSGRRWWRSTYLDTEPRTVSLRLQDFEPADGPTMRRPIVTPIGTLLFVVDTVNTAPGTAGTIWLWDVELGARRLE